MTGLPHPASYWAATAGPSPFTTAPLAADRTAEVAVIGAGYTGLAAAYHLAGTHRVETVVLEAQRVGWGASGRNGGFVMPGMGKLDLRERIAKWGRAAARRSLEIEVESVAAVKALIAAERIACEAQEAGYLYVAHRPDRVRVLEAEARLYAEVGGPPALEVLDRDALVSRGFLAGPSAHGGLRNPHAFGLHPLKYAYGLAAAAARRGAVVHEATPVSAWIRDRGWHHLSTPGGTLRARRVVMATNGYTPERLHPFFAGRTLPAMSNIVVTRPLTEAEWTATGTRTTQPFFDTRNLVHYWRRLPDGRLLYGGRGGVVDSDGSARGREAWLLRRIRARFPDLPPLEAEFFWYGNVCLPYDVTPHVHTVEDDRTVAYAIGYTGTGVALSTYSGRVAADLVLGRDVPRDTPLTSAGLPRFPLPALRRLYLGAAYALFGLKDRMR